MTETLPKGAKRTIVGEPVYRVGRSTYTQHAAEVGDVVEVVSGPDSDGDYAVRSVRTDTRFDVSPANLSPTAAATITVSVARVEALLGVFGVVPTEAERFVAVLRLLDGSDA